MFTTMVVHVDGVHIPFIFMIAHATLETHEHPGVHPGEPFDLAALCGEMSSFLYGEVGEPLCPFAIIGEVMAN